MRTVISLSLCPIEEITSFLDVFANNLANSRSILMRFGAFCLERHRKWSWRHTTTLITLSVTINTLTGRKSPTGTPLINSSFNYLYDEPCYAKAFVHLFNSGVLRASKLWSVYKRMWRSRWHWSWKPSRFQTYCKVGTSFLFVNTEAYCHTMFFNYSTSRQLN